MTAFDATVDRLGAALDGAEQIVRDGLVAAYREGIADGERIATERTVAYLRERANAEHPIESGVPSLSPAGRFLLLLHADRIERGEHLKKEEEP